MAVAADDVVATTVPVASTVPAERAEATMPEVVESANGDITTSQMPSGQDHFPLYYFSASSTGASPNWGSCSVP